jgi:F0F1-type ATP synthase assembly protein I
MDANEKSEDGDLKRALFSVSDAVLGAAVLLAIGVYGGAWLDQKLHTAPWLSVGLALLGGAVGLARMIMKAQAIGKNDSASTSKKIAGSGHEPISGRSAEDWDKDDDWGVRPQVARSSQEEKSPKENTFQAKPEDQAKTKESSRYRLPHEGFTDE